MATVLLFFRQALLFVLGVLELIPGWLWAGVVAFLLLSKCALTHDLAQVQGDYESARQEAVRLEHERETVSQVAQALRNQISEIRDTTAKEIDDAVKKERAVAARAAASGAAERDRLRDATEKAASGGGAGGEDPAAVTRAAEAARAFGRLLVSCDAVAEGLGRDAEDLAAQVRGLTARYESLSLRPQASALDPFPDLNQVDPRAGLRRHRVVHPAQPDPAL